MTGSALLVGDVRPVEPDPFNDLETVGLAELNARAALQTRVDRKYLLAGRDIVGLFNDLRTEVRVLEINGQQHADYASTYFDTPAFDSYLAAARSRPNRFKVRVRSYLDNEAHYLEVKSRSRTRHTTKTRWSAAAQDHGGLSSSGLAFVHATLTDELPTRAGLGLDAAVAALRPTLSTHYRRTTLLVESADDGPSRATIDTSLAFSGPGRNRASFPALAIIETKTEGPPSPIDRLLWRSGHRPMKVSKFGVGVALFHPELPASKWNRILRRDFGRTPRSTFVL